MYSADVSDSSAWSLSGYVARTSPFMSVRFGFFITKQWWDMGGSTSVIHCLPRDGDSRDATLHLTLPPGPRSHIW